MDLTHAVTHTADRRSDHAMRALCAEWFNRVMRGEAGVEEAGHALDRAGVPFETQCRLMIESTSQPVQVA